MITDILSSIQRDRANYVRNLAYLKEMAMDDEIADRMDKVEHKFERATADDYESAMDVIREMADDYPDEDEAEIRSSVGKVPGRLFWPYGQCQLG